MVLYDGPYRFMNNRKFHKKNFDAEYLQIIWREQLKPMIISYARIKYYVNIISRKILVPWHR